MVAVGYGVLVAVAAIVGALIGYRIGSRRLLAQYAGYLDTILAGMIEDIASMAAGHSRSSDIYQHGRAMATVYSLMRQNTAEVLRDARPVSDTQGGTGEGEDERRGSGAAPALDARSKGSGRSDATRKG